MKVLLHNFETRLYYAGTDEWTEDSALAFDFGSVEKAVDAYKSGRVTFAEVVIDDGPMLRKPMPLPDEP